MIIEDPTDWRNCQKGKIPNRDFKLCIGLLIYPVELLCCQILLNYHHQQILYILDCCIRCWYCKDHIDWLYDDHISFHLKPQILQLHNWIEWVLSILCLSSVKLSADLQSVQQQYDNTFVSWSTPNWTKLVLNVISQYVINSFYYFIF